MDDELPLTHATERDIDLLLVEELKTSPSFLEWFVSQAGKPIEPIISVVVSHSVRRIHNRREIDIYLILNTAKETVHLLIENKLDADEQPLQSESYTAEAKTIRAENHAALTALVCPFEYAERHNLFKNNFDFSISYEDIIDFFSSRAQCEKGEIAARHAFASSGNLIRESQHHWPGNRGLDRKRSSGTWFSFNILKICWRTRSSVSPFFSFDFFSLEKNLAYQTFCACMFCSRPSRRYLVLGVASTDAS